MRPNKPLEWAGPLRFAAYALKLLPATQGQRSKDHPLNKLAHLLMFSVEDVAGISTKPGILCSA